LYSWELTERLGWKEGARNSRKLLSSFFLKTCLSKRLPIHNVKNFLGVSPRQSERLTALKSQISSILGPRGMNMAKRSFWVNQKSRLQQETLKSPAEFLEGD